MNDEVRIEHNKYLVFVDKVIEARKVAVEAKRKVIEANALLEGYLEAKEAAYDVYLDAKIKAKEAENKK